MAEVFNSAIQCLKEEDRQLPFIQAMLPMLQAGVAVHHSGAAVPAALPEQTHRLVWASPCLLASSQLRGGPTAAMGPPAGKLRAHAACRAHYAAPTLPAAAFVQGCYALCSAGLLPILKELVEILFQEQLVKVGCANRPPRRHRQVATESTPQALINNSMAWGVRGRVLHQPSLVLPVR